MVSCRVELKIGVTTVIVERHIGFNSTSLEARGKEIGEAVSNLLIGVQTSTPLHADYFKAMEHTSRTLIETAILAHGGNMTEARQSLGLNKAFIFRMVGKFAKAEGLTNKEYLRRLRARLPMRPGK